VLLIVFTTATASLWWSKRASAMLRK